MPVSGIPDPDKHWPCIKCRQWFESDEGQLIKIEKPTIVGKLVDALSEDEKFRFRCDDCAKRSQRNRLLFVGVAATILLIAAVYQLT
jgi:hypothetical protein